MKKVLIARIILISILGMMFIPLSAKTADITPGEAMPTGCTMSYEIGTTGACPTVGGVCEFKSTTFKCGVCCTLNSIMTVTNWIFYILILVAVIMIIVGGFMFITAAGSPERVKSARMVIIYAVIGLAIAVVAKIIPGLVRFVVGF